MLQFNLDPLEGTQKGCNSTGSNSLLANALNMQQKLIVTDIDILVGI